MSEEIKKQARKDSSVDGLRSLADLPQHKRDQAISESMKHAKSAGIDTARIDRGKLNNPEFLHKTANDIKTKGAPEDDSAMVIGALAAFAPAILGTLFGGVAVGAEAIKGTIEGAKTGLEAGAKIDELKLEAEKEDDLEVSFQSGIITKDTGEPLLKTSDGRFLKRDIKGKLKEVPFSNVKTLRAEDIRLASGREARLTKKDKWQKVVKTEEMTVDATDEFNKLSKNLRESYLKGEQALSMVNSKNPVADNAIVNFLVKLSGDTGNLTEEDKKPFRKFGDWIDRVKSATSRWLLGKMSNQDRIFLREFIKTAQEKNIELSNRLKTQVVKQRKGTVVGEKKLKERLDIKEPTPKKDTPKTDLETRRQTLEERRDKLIKRRDELLKKKKGK